MEEEEPRPFGVLAASLWCVGSALGASLLVAIFEGLRPGAASDLVTLTVARLLTVAVVVLGVARLHFPEASFQDVLGVGKARTSQVVLALVLGLALCICLGFVDERLAAAFPSHDEADHSLSEKLLTAPSPERRAFLVAALMLILPACHELLFRGVVLTSLAKTSKVMDAAVTAMLLEILTVGLAGDVRALPSTVAFAAAATYVRVATKSIIPAIALHVAFYASVLAVAYRPALAERDVPPAWAALAAVVAVGSVLLLRVTSRAPVERLETT